MNAGKRNGRTRLALQLVAVATVLSGVAAVATFGQLANLPPLLQVTANAATAAEDSPTDEEILAGFATPNADISSATAAGLWKKPAAETDDQDASFEFSLPVQSPSAHSAGVRETPRMPAAARHDENPFLTDNVEPVNRNAGQSRGGEPPREVAQATVEENPFLTAEPTAPALTHRQAHRPVQFAETAEQTQGQPPRPQQHAQEMLKDTMLSARAAVASGSFTAYRRQRSGSQSESPRPLQLAQREVNPPAASPPKTSAKPVGTTAQAAGSTEANAGGIDLRRIEELRNAGEDAAAHRLLSAWYWKYPEKRPLFQKQLDELATIIYFSPQPHFHEPYVVQPGDLLQKIGSKYKLSWQYISRVNKVDPRRIRPGQRLKVTQGPFDAFVDLSDYELTIHQRGLYVRRYRVGIGKDGSSPIGEFPVKEKLENPTYYGPDGDVRAADDPLNPLGERWIDIGDSFGIHGTIEPESIGKSESRGCIRLLNSDVEEVYDLLTIGSTVRIQR